MQEPPLIAQVAALLQRHDPVALDFGDNPDEYRPEAEGIVARLPGVRSVDELHRVVHAEFVRFFDDGIAGPADRYAAIAREIWSVWCARRRAPS